MSSSDRELPSFNNTDSESEFVFGLIDGLVAKQGTARDYVKTATIRIDNNFFIYTSSSL